MSNKKTPMPANKKPKSPSAAGDFDSLVASIAHIYQQARDFSATAVEAHVPIVQEILSSDSQDARLIEHTLDHLLDHACIPQGFTLFKSLCRHYWEINPHATASYVNAYREMWDSDDKSETEVEP